MEGFNNDLKKHLFSIVNVIFSLACLFGVFVIIIMVADLINGKGLIHSKNDAILIFALLIILPILYILKKRLRK